MPEKSRDVLPEITVHPEDPWRKNLSPRERKAWEKRRSNEIERDRAGYVAKLRKLSAFDCLSDDAVNYIALESATFAADAFEEGIQAGLDAHAKETAREIDRQRSFMMNVVGNNG